MNIGRIFLLLPVVCISLTLSVPVQADLVDVADPVLDATSAQSAAFEPVIQALEARDFDKAVELLNALKSTHAELPGTWELDGAIKLARMNFAGAERALRRALVLAPDTASIHTKLGAALLAQNQEVDAERSLAKAVELDPAESSASLMLARLETRRGNSASALAHYKTAVQYADGYSTAHQELVEVYLSSGDYEAALRLVEPLLETDGTAAAHSAAMRAYISLERLDEAGEALETARQLGLAAEEATLYEAVLARFTGDLGKSESLLRNLLNDYADRPLLLQELAITLAAAGNSSESRDAAMHAAALLPEQHPTLVSLANLLLAQGLASEALQVAQGNAESGDLQALVVVSRAGILAGELDVADDASQRLLTDYPQYSEAYQYRTEVLLRTGERAKALEVAEQGTRSLPQNVAVWSTRIGLLLRLGETKSAARVAEQSVNANPDSTHLKLQMANALQLNGDAEAAEVLYRELSSDEGTSVIALNNLANMVSADPDRRAEALEFARKAHSQAPESAAVNDTLGWVLHLNGKNDEARDALDVAHAAAAGNIEVICHLGIVKAGLDGVEAARANLEKCAASDIDVDLSSQAARLLGT